MSDEERSLRYCLARNRAGRMHATGSIRSGDDFERPLVRLVKETALCGRPYCFPITGKCVNHTLRSWA